MHQSYVNETGKIYRIVHSKVPTLLSVHVFSHCRVLKQILFYNTARSEAIQKNLKQYPYNQKLDLNWIGGSSADNFFLVSLAKLSVFNMNTQLKQPV